MGGPGGGTVGALEPARQMSRVGKPAFERNHQGLNNELIKEPRDEPNMDGAVGCQQRLGGILKYYSTIAA